MSSREAHPIKKTHFLFADRMEEVGAFCGLLGHPCRRNSAAPVSAFRSSPRDPQFPSDFTFCAGAQVPLGATPTEHFLGPMQPECVCVCVFIGT